MKRVPDRCRPCVLLNYGKAGTRYAVWCCAHSMPAKRADSHCRSAPANDKRRVAS